MSNNEKKFLDSNGLTVLFKTVKDNFIKLGDTYVTDDTGQAKIKITGSEVNTNVYSIDGDDTNSSISVDTSGVTVRTSNYTSDTTIYVENENGITLKASANDDNGDLRRNTLWLTQDGRLLHNDSPVMTENNTNVLKTDENGVVNKSELSIGNFEIKNDKPYSYTLEGEYAPYDWGGDGQPDGEWNAKIVAEYNQEGAKLYDYFSNGIPNIPEGEQWFYEFIVTEALWEKYIDDDDSELGWVECPQLIGTRLLILAAYLDSDYYVEGIEKLTFTDGKSTILNNTTADEYNERQLYNVVFTQSAPFSLRHTSKALLNGVPVATLDDIQNIQIDNTLDSSSTNAISNSAVTNAINEIEEVTSTALTDLNNKIDNIDIPETPIVKGDANYSAVLDGEYNGYSNNAISQVSTSFGAASTSGLKGWYYTKVNLSENLIWLSDTRSTGILQIKISTTTSTTPDSTSFVCGWKVGDEVTIVNDKKYDRCAKIESINGNMIKLDKLPFDSETIVKSAASIGNYNEPDEFSITAIRITDNDTFKTRTLSSYDKGNIDFGGGAHAEGVQTYALNIGAHAEGVQTIAHGQYSHTEGFRTEAAYAAHAEGRQSKALGRQSHAEGENNEAHGDNSHVEGKNSKTLSKFSHAEGNTTIAKGEASHTEGYKTISVNNTSHAEGSQTVAYGGNAHAEGQGGSYDAEIYNKTNEEIVALWDAKMKINCALGKSSHTEGLNTLAAGDYSHAEGQHTKAAGSDSHAEGNQTKALENNAHAEGVSSVALGNAAHAEGNTTISSGKASHAEGIETIASKDGAHSEGYKTEASELYAHAEGNETKASGKYSHTEGYMTEATTNNAHAEGNQTKAQGNSAHAEGKLTVAAKDFSHAGGLSSIASGIGSFAHGNYVTATKDYEIAFGKFNVSNDDTIFSIGNGTDENSRSNILEIKHTSSETTVNYQAPKTDILFSVDFSHSQEINDKTILVITYVSSNSDYATYKITYVNESNYKFDDSTEYIHCYDCTEHLILSVGDLLYVPLVKPTWESEYTGGDSEDKIIGYENNRCMYINTTCTKNNAIRIVDCNYNPGLVQLIESATNSLFVNGARVLIEDDGYIKNTKSEILAESKDYTDNTNSEFLAESKAYTDNTNSEILAESKAYTDDKLKDIDIDINLPLQSTANGGIITINDDRVRSNEATGKSSFAMGGYVADSGNIYNGCNALGSASFSGGVDNYSNGICSFTYGFGLNTTTVSQKYGEAAFGKYNNSTSDTLFSVGNGTSDSGRKNAFEVKTNGRVYASSFYETSDERIKIFTKPIETDLDKLSALRKSYFTYIEAPGTTQIGVSAQEVQKLYPEIVSENSDGLLTVDYSKLSVIALNAIDVLHKKNKELEDRLAKLESIVKNML